MIEALVYFIIYLVVIGLIAWLLLYIVDSVPQFEPFRSVARVVIIVFCCLILIILLLQILPTMPLRLR